MKKIFVVMRLLLYHASTIWSPPPLITHKATTSLPAGKGGVYLRGPKPAGGALQGSL